MLKPIVHGDQRELHEPCLFIDGALQILQLNPPLARLHHAKIESSALLKGLEVQKGAVKMQRIGYHISPGARNIQPVDNQVFSSTGVGYEADLRLLRVNQ